MRVANAPGGRRKRTSVLYRGDLQPEAQRAAIALAS